VGRGQPVAVAAVAAVVASGAAFAQQSDTPVVKQVGQIHDKLRMAKEREGAALAGKIDDVASRYARMATSAGFSSITLNVGTVRMPAGGRLAQRVADRWQRRRGGQVETPRF
jgi:hypothetical protein